MSRGHILLWFKASFVRRLTNLSLGSTAKRKPARPPSPTISTVLPDYDEGTPSLDEKSPTFVVNLDPKLWREILSYCGVIDIVHVGMTCRTLASAAKDYWVWYFALLRISHDRRLPYLRFHLKTLSCSALRQKAILSAQLDHLSRGLDPRPFPYTTTAISLPVSVVWGISFLPGGEWLVVLCRKAGEDGVLLCKASNPFGEPSAYSSISGWNLTNMCIFMSDEGDLLLLLRSDRPDATRLVVYVIHPFDSCPELRVVWSLEVAEIENCAALGNHVVYGWIDRNSTEPRHLIAVLKLTPCYRGLALKEHCTVQVEWEVGKWPHSYGLRITETQIIVVVSSTKLVAAYEIPFMDQASFPSEPVAVAPFWRFACAHMRPSAVYLVPSLPAVDTPSVIILYGTRCLLIAPCFDTDPLRRHPTYFSTYTYPRELKRPMLLGPHRAFWDLGRGRVGIGMLPAPVTPAFCERGAWDMTGIHAPEANLGNDVHPLGHAGLCKGKVVRAAWDEESGKLALCPKSDPLLVIIVNLTSY